MTQIIGYYAGDTLDITRTPTGVPTADPMVKAWFTVKSAATDADAAALIQKVITTAPAPGTGQILQDGSPASGNGTGLLLFNLLPADTNKLAPGRPYPYDVKVALSSGKVFTVDAGPITMLQRVTTALA
jgi:hypothetical protein